MTATNSRMKKLIRTTTFAALFIAFSLGALADDLARLEGKWSTKKTGPDGQSYTQVIEIKKNKFQFRILHGTDEVALYAEGNLKAETAGAFSVARFTDIKAGASESEAQPINDDRASIYVLADDTWTLASNFDKERDNQKPSSDVYIKVKK